MAGKKCWPIEGTQAFLDQPPWVREREREKGNRDWYIIYGKGVCVSVSACTHIILCPFLRDGDGHKIAGALHRVRESRLDEQGMSGALGFKLPRTAADGTDEGGVNQVCSHKVHLEGGM